MLATEEQKRCAFIASVSRTAKNQIGEPVAIHVARGACEGNEADVSESSLAKVRLEQPVEIELDALPDRRFRGVVSRMVPTVDRSKATVMTKIRFVDIDPRVLPEMSAKAIFLTQPVTDAQREPRTAVNPAAVVERDGRDVAFVVEDGTARRRDVRRGQKVGDLVEIADGLAPGDKVVLNPADKLADGNKVKPAAK